MNGTLPDVLERAALSDPARFGFRFLDRHENACWISFGEFRSRVACAADAMHEQGVRPGDRVAIILPTCPEFLELFFAAQWLGAIPVALYPPVRLGRLEEYHQRTAAMLEAVRASVLYTDSRIGRMLGETVLRYRPALGVKEAWGLRSGSPRARARSETNAIAMVQFSSGTTVDPKPVALTHAQVLANAERITSAVFSLLPPSQGFRPAGVTWLPLYHDMGLIGCVLPALLGPGPLTLISPELFVARPAIWLRAISRYRGTTSPAPDFAYAICVDRIRDEELDGCDLSCWRMAMNGAEPLSASTLRAFENRFRRWGFRPDALMPVYGLSEATLAVTFTTPGTKWRSRRFDPVALAHGIAQPSEAGGEWVSSGSPLPGFTVEIRNDRNEPLSPARIGRIHVRGPSLMNGYLDRRQSPIRDGWLDTGDVGFVHEEQLYVTGRAKDVLVLRGLNHAPQELERAVDRIDGVRTGCAAAVAHLTPEGERVLLFVEARTVRDSLEEECREAVLAACGVALEQVVILAPGTLPRTSSGKIRRGETRRLWESGQLHAPRHVNIAMIGSAMVRSAVGYVRSRFRAGGTPA